MREKNSLFAENRETYRRKLFKMKWSCEVVPQKSNGPQKQSGLLYTRLHLDASLNYLSKLSFEITA